MRCPYCGSQYVSRQQVPVKAISKLLIPGLILLLIGWPFKLKLMAFAGIGLTLFGLIIAMVTTIPCLIIKKRMYWECDSCDRVFDMSESP